jgi:hypothetical protein
MFTSPNEEAAQARYEALSNYGNSNGVLKKLSTDSSVSLLFILNTAKYILVMRHSVSWSDVNQNN